MGGMFPSSAYATVLVPAPFSLTTPAVLGNIIQTDYDVTLANLNCSIASVAADGTVTPFFNDTMDNLPADISAGPFGGCIVMSFNPSIFDAGVWMIVISDTSTTNYSQTSASFQWGGIADLLTQVPAQNTRQMLNNGQSYRQGVNPPFLFPAVVDPTSGLPYTIGSPVLTVQPPSGGPQTLTVAWDSARNQWANTSNASNTGGGKYAATLTQTIGGVTFRSTGFVEWGGDGTVELDTRNALEGLDAKVTDARFFEYDAGQTVKSKLWIRLPDDSAWAGYWPAYANTTTGGVWPPASISWPTTYPAATSFGAFVNDSAGPA